MREGCLAIKIAVLMLLAMSVTTPKMVFSQPKIYILSVKECSYIYWGAYVPEQFASLTESLLESIAKNWGIELEVKVIKTIEEWESLMNMAQEGIIIINAHTDYVPIPPKYGLDWKKFIDDLSSNIVNNGWVWVQPAGYGFNYFYYNFTRRDEGGWRYDTYQAGAAGLQALTANLGYTFSPEIPNIPSSATLSITDEGRRAFGAMGFDMPEALPIGGRYPVISETAPKWFFYQYTDTVEAFACAAFTAGRGAIIWGGLGPGLAGQGDVSERIARVTTAMVLYYLYPEKILQAQEGFVGLWQYALIGVAIVAIVAIFIIFLRRR